LRIRIQIVAQAVDTIARKYTEDRALMVGKLFRKFVINESTKVERKSERTIRCITAKFIEVISHIESCNTRQA